MNPPKSFVQIIDRKRYSVADAELIAGDNYWDGRNSERQGRNQFLFRSKKGNYFLFTMSQWEEEIDYITPLSEEEAADYYENQLVEHSMPYEQAFPRIKVEDA